MSWFPPVPDPASDAGFFTPQDRPAGSLKAGRLVFFLRMRNEINDYVRFRIDEPPAQMQIYLSGNWHRLAASGRRCQTVVDGNAELQVLIRCLGYQNRIPADTGRISVIRTKMRNAPSGCTRNWKATACRDGWLAARRPPVSFQDALLLSFVIGKNCRLPPTSAKPSTRHFMTPQV